MKKVVVVDDAVEVLDLICGILRSSGYEAVALQHTVGLEEKLQSERPDVLLLDVVMPGRDGYQILRSLKKNAATRELPVVLVSFKTELTDVAWGRQQGADDYLTKPFTAQQLLDCVSRLAS